MKKVKQNKELPIFEFKYPKTFFFPVHTDFVSFSFINYSLTKTPGRQYKFGNQFFFSAIHLKC